MNPTLEAVRLTPPGRGAVATLRIEGPGALETVAERFFARGGRPLREFAENEIAVGHFGGQHGEEVVVRHCPDGAIELHCHGGEAAVTAIVAALASAGCRAMDWRTWMTRSVERGTTDPILAAALTALADARTERCAAILLDQYHGAFRRELDEIRRLASSSCEREWRIESLRSRAALGRHLTRPWSVVLAGRPNVGKSSLMNALAGFSRAIVHHQPGTTRDPVSLATAIDGWPVELFDTAGLRPATDEIERAGVERAQRQIADADLIILVADRSTPWSAEDQSLRDEWPAAILVHNKSDLPAAPGERPPGLIISATEGEGMESLQSEISRRLVPDPPPPGAGVPLTREQETMLASYSSRSA